MKGFFAESESVELSGGCMGCRLDRGCKSPKMPVTGRGRRGVLIVAEAPGKEEDERGTQLIGRAGQHLRKCLAKIGVDLDRDCWKTNAVCCRPPDNAKPTMKQIACCRPNVLGALSELKPSVVLLLGQSALDSVVGHMQGQDVGSISRWVGWRIPCWTVGAWVCPTWHPSYLLREKEDPVLSLWFGRHLEAAISLEGRPPEFRAKVRRIYDESEAADFLHEAERLGGLVSFDYETNRLKPDQEDARIVSCGVCLEDGRTAAFTVGTVVVDPLSELLKSKRVGKVGWNIKFEERWTRAVLGHGVRGWIHDGMIAAHMLDNRPGVTGAKFQAFVRLGVLPYDRVVGPLLKSVDARGRNRIGEAKLEDLLLYNGMDAAVEFALARIQMEELKCGFGRG